jgi:hypothetical protein
LQWLAIRDAVELVTPYEDLICDGSPAPEESLQGLSSSAVVNAMIDDKDGTLLIASSTMPYGVASSFSVRSAKADARWLLCDLVTKRSVAASAGGSAAWQTGSELGSMLVFGPATVCHNNSVSPHSDNGARVRRAAGFYTDDDDRLAGGVDAPAARPTSSSALAPDPSFSCTLGGVPAALETYKLSNYTVPLVSFLATHMDLSDAECPKHGGLGHVATITRRTLPIGAANVSVWVVGKSASVTESGKPAAVAEGVRLLREATRSGEAYSVWAVASGSYSFVSRPLVRSAAFGVTGAFHTSNPHGCTTALRGKQDRELPSGLTVDCSRTLLKHDDDETKPAVPACPSGYVSHSPGYWTSPRSDPPVCNTSGVPPPLCYTKNTMDKCATRCKSVSDCLAFEVGGGNYGTNNSACYIWHGAFDPLSFTLFPDGGMGTCVKAGYHPPPPPPPLHDMKILTSYGGTADQLHGTVNVITADCCGGKLDACTNTTITGQFGMKVLLNVENQTGACSGPLGKFLGNIWSRGNGGGCKSPKGLCPDWEQYLDAYIRTMKPHVDSGNVFGIFLGVSAANVLPPTALISPRGARKALPAALRCSRLTSNPSICFCCRRTKSSVEEFRTPT